MRINFGRFILGDDMVALSENGFYHPGAHGINFDTKTQSVRRKGESSRSEGVANHGYSASSVTSAAVKYANGGLADNVPNGTTDYVWSGWQVVEERNSSNTPIRQYIWGTYIDECIELTTFVALGIQNLEPGSYYLVQDLLYRAAALTDSTGTVVEAYDTDAYGNTLIFTGPGTDGVWFTDDDVQSSYGANEIIYCGYRFDPESEVYYVRNRSDNSVLGRWIQRDPIGYESGINLYEYVWGIAPVTVDPDGMAGVPASEPKSPPAKCRCPTGYRSLGRFLVTEYIIAHEADYPGGPLIKAPGLNRRYHADFLGGRSLARERGGFTWALYTTQMGAREDREVRVCESYPDCQRITSAGRCHNCRRSTGDSAENAGVYSECWLA